MALIILFIFLDKFITDIIAIFQGDIQLSDCMLRNKLCDNRLKRLP